jgi:hypothetical protein
MIATSFTRFFKRADLLGYVKANSPELTMAVCNPHHCNKAETRIGRASLKCAYFSKACDNAGGQAGRRPTYFALAKYKKFA